MTSILMTLPSKSPRGQTRHPGLRVPEGHVCSEADAALEPMSGLALPPRPPRTARLELRGSLPAGGEKPERELAAAEAGTARSLCSSVWPVLGGPGLRLSPGRRDGLGVRDPEDPRPVPLSRPTGAGTPPAQGVHRAGREGR